MTGDIHSSWALDIARDPWDASAYDPATGRGSLAVEFVTPAVSARSLSGGVPERATEGQNQTLADSPHIKFVELLHRGYFVLDVTRERAHADWFFVPTVTEQTDEQSFVIGFSTASGANHLTEASEPVPGRSDVPPLAPPTT